LKKYQDGLLILKLYTTKGILNNASRNSLASILIKHKLQIELNHQITKSKFLLSAEGKQLK
jgi:type III secretory pathway lipoprotein EscJ